MYGYTIHSVVTTFRRWKRIFGWIAVIPLRMSDIQNASSTVIDLARDLIETVRGIDPSWTRAYYRLRVEPSQHGSNASFTAAGLTKLIDPFKNSAFFDRMNAVGTRLVASLNKEHAVVLLTAGSDFSYQIFFEHENLDRWKISKLNGGTGAPEGLSLPEGSN